MTHDDGSRSPHPCFCDLCKDSGCEHCNGGNVPEIPDGRNYYYAPMTLWDYLCL